MRKTFEISHDKHQTIYSMEGVRGFAVFLVFLVHYMTLIEPWVENETLVYQVVEYIRDIGNVGVDLFFCLSGYLIYGMLLKKKFNLVKYFKRRVQRIYPVFTVVLVVYIFLSFVFPNESKIPNSWGAALIYIGQNFLLMPGLFDVVPIITVAWSLSYEFFYYIFSPALLSFLSMRIWLPKYRALFFVLMSIFLFAYFSIDSKYIRLLMFVPGILVFEVLENSLPVKMPLNGVVFLLFIFVFLVLFKYFGVDGLLKYMFLFLFLFLFFLDCFSPKSFSYKFFSMSYLRWYGNMSYSYYLIHGLSLKTLFMFLSYLCPVSCDFNGIVWLLFVPFFIFTLIPSLILFVFIEKPYSLTR